MAYVDAMRGFSVFSINDADEAETVLCKTLVDARFTRVVDRDRFKFLLSRYNLGSISLIANRYESHTEIESGESGIHDKTMHVILGGSVASEFSVDGKSFQLSPSKGVVLVSGKKIRVKRNPGSEILLLRLTRSRLIKFYELFLDRQLSGDIDFQTGVDLTRGAGAFLKQLTSNLLFEIQRYEEVISHEFTRKIFEELLLGTLLQLPHNKATAINQKRTAEIAPGIVVRAEEYIRAHLSEPITVAELLAVTGCSRAALYTHFRKTRGYSPMDFLLEQRLQKAKREIMTSVPEESISYIALNCGFSHLGRFAQSYRKRFGELPSETLRKN